MNSYSMYHELIDTFIDHGRVCNGEIGIGVRSNSENYVMLELICRFNVLMETLLKGFWGDMVTDF